jgi:hypothetical protein
MTEKFIVITSIHSPAEAIKKFSELSDWQVIVVADRKTPQTWQSDRVKLLSVEEQTALPLKTAQFLPWNHYARKNMGYLYAMMQGAKLIYETDDDNIPYDSWEMLFPTEQTIVAESYGNTKKYVNAYQHFCQAHIWPRGFPLSEILFERSDQQPESLTISKSAAPILQGLADLEPDVDAIYRLTIGKSTKFSQQNPLWIAPGTYCPFNSQNTLWYPPAFPYLFLPSFVPSRVTDIWRGYITQRFLHQNGQGVLFFNASVYQERNYHNLMHDFAEEILLYTKTNDLVEALDRYDGGFADAFQYLASLHFFKPEEVALFAAWLQDLKDLGIEF